MVLSLSQNFPLLCESQSREVTGTVIIVTEYVLLHNIATQQFGIDLAFGKVI